MNSTIITCYFRNHKLIAHSSNISIRTLPSKTSPICLATATVLFHLQLHPGPLNIRSLEAARLPPLPLQALRLTLLPRQRRSLSLPRPNVEGKS